MTTPQRLFWIDATRWGLPVTVFHVLDSPGATMRGTLASLVPIVDAHGPEMDVSETVTLFNDLVVFAPAGLPDAPITWMPLGDDRVRATYTRGQIAVTADLFFSPEGDLVDFRSEDRWRAFEDGRSYSRLPWSTPITQFRDIGGRRVAVAGQALWAADPPEGQFPYIEFFIDDLVYNTTEPSHRRPSAGDAAQPRREDPSTTSPPPRAQEGHHERL